MTERLRPAWPDAFEAIRRDFGYALEPDLAAAEALARRLARPPYRPGDVVAEARAQAEGNTVWVVGAGDRARDEVEAVEPHGALWVADGAATAALEAGRRPDVIVTDLDGALEDEAAAATRGALVFVHAHGDNIAALEAELGRFPAHRVAGTCQVAPVPPLLNPGGFTDGDRAVHLAVALGAREVRLLGFDFERVGRYAGRYDPATKPRKLAWARRLIQDLIDGGAPVRFG